MKINAVNSKDTALKIDAKTAVAVANSNAAGSDARKDNNIDKKLQEAVRKLNEEAETTNREIRFAIHKDTHRIMIEVLDRRTNQVVSTFPPQQILDMLASMEKDTKLADKKV